MKISAFYVNQKQQTITEKDVKKAFAPFVKLGIATIIVTTSTNAIPMELIDVPIVASANSGIDMVIQANQIQANEKTRKQSKKRNKYLINLNLAPSNKNNLITLHSIHRIIFVLL